MTQTSLRDADLLLIIEMCNEGIEKCNLREEEHLRNGNNQAAEWTRRVRDRYNHLRGEILVQVEQRRRALGSGTGEGVHAGSGRKPDTDPAQG